MVGLIFSSIVSGLIVSRTGRYKWLIVGSIVAHGLRGPADDPAHQGHAGADRLAVDVHRRPGRRPDVLGLTIVVQNAVPFRQLGVATSNLTFFRQIGGTIALAFVGHDLRRRRSRTSSCPQMAAAGVPQPVVDGLQPGERQRLVRLQPADRRRRPGRGASWPPSRRSSRPPSQPFIPSIVEGIHGAFSLAIAQTFWLGVVGAIVAAVAAVAIKEIPLRTSNEAPVPTQAVGRRRRPAPSRHGADAARASTTVGD